MDRIKELIKYKAWQVAPADLEALLLTHPDIADVAVIPSPDEDAGEVPKAFVVARAPLTAAGVMDYVAARVGAYERVRRRRLRRPVPKSASGKILRRVLVERERAARRDERDDGVTGNVATDAYRRGIRAAQLGMAVNAGLAAIKLMAGVVGHTYALVADAVESTVDIVGSGAVWGGLAVAARPADEDHPYGHGKAESLAALAVALLVLAAGGASRSRPSARSPRRTGRRPPGPWPSWPGS